MDPVRPEDTPPRREAVATPGGRVVRGCGLLAAALLASLLAHGYAFELGAENQPLQIPLIERLRDPALYPGDPLVDTLGKYHSLFFPLAASLERWIALEHLFFVLHLLTTAVTAAVMWAIAGRLSGSRPAAAVAVLLLLVSPVIRPTVIGRDTLVAAWVTPTTISFPILLLALHWLLAGRYARAGLAAGLAVHVNAVAAGIFMIVATPVALGERRGWRPAGALVAIFVAAALPTLLTLPTGALVHGRGLDFLALLRRYYPYHFFLGAHAPGVFLRLLILIAAAIAGFRALNPGDVMRRARRLALAVGATVALGALFADLVPIAALTQLHLLRADRWFYVLVFAVAGRLLVAPTPRRDRVEMAGAIAIAAGLLRAAYPLIAWGAVVLLLRPAGGRARAAVVLAAAAIAIWRLWEPSYALTTALLLALVLLAAAGTMRQVAFAARTGVVVALVLASVEVALLVGTIGAHGLAISRQVFHPDWREVQDWADGATPPEARFLTPPEYAGFRVYARRSTIVEWKDGAAMLWEPDFGPGWWERVTAVETAIAARDAFALSSVAERYGAGWVIVPVGSTPDTAAPELTPVHNNSRFTVYAVTGAVRN